MMVLPLLLCAYVSVYADDSPKNKEKENSTEKSLTLKGILIQKDGTPAGNVKVYMQEAFFPDNDRSRIRTKFTTNNQGQLLMPFGITDKQGNFTVTYPLQQAHFNFALSIRQGRVSLDFPIIKIFELTEAAWKQRNRQVFNIGKLSIPEGWEIDHFERGSY